MKVCLLIVVSPFAIFCQRFHSCFDRGQLSVELKQNGDFGWHKLKLILSDLGHGYFFTSRWTRFQIANHPSSGWFELVTVCRVQETNGEAAPLLLPTGGSWIFPAAGLLHVASAPRKWVWIVSGCPKMVPQNSWFARKILLNWMMTGGSPFSGNPHFLPRRGENYFRSSFGRLQRRELWMPSGLWLLLRWGGY